MQLYTRTGLPQPRVLVARSLVCQNNLRPMPPRTVVNAEPNEQPDLTNPYPNGASGNGAFGPPLGDQHGAIPNPAPAPQSPAIPSALWEIELLRGDNLNELTIERWTSAYKEMCSDARIMGIPASALPQLPQNPTKEDLRSARDYLNLMIQSFLSAGL